MFFMIIEYRGRSALNKYIPLDQKKKARITSSKFPIKAHSIRRGVFFREEFAPRIRDYRK